MPKISFISLDALLEKKVNDEKFVLLDVLSEDQFKEGHLPNSINIPLEKLPETAETHLRKTDVIVTYCGGYTCNASTQAAFVLQGMGFHRTYDFKAGKKSWVQNGLPLEK